ncbi:TrmB family transcriptional regulator [Halomicrobium urmianum]|uniref:TrmB family transcriptional regulator n=1 Tax=Halomicrobium urmianum TaxID=1586233 RepID=UPI001CDA2800|nr:TrmB family transcriptional regulator sugar-binding domain-containing protein [Halomicrobium urmianum]
MSESQLRDALSAFGLSEKEVDAYLAVVRRGEATTRAVSAAADVSQSYVYEIAGELANRGLVTVDESETPTVLRARPPEEVVDALSMHVTELESAVADLYSEPSRSGPGFEVVRSHRTVRRRAQSHVDRAEHDVFCLVPAESFDAVREQLAAAVDRGVDVYCLLAGPTAESLVDGFEDPGEYATVVRTWDGRPPAFVLRDGDAGVLASSGMLRGRSSENYAVAFDQPEVASGFFGNYVSNIWPMGTQRFVAEPPALPATFDYYRTGVTAAALHQTAGHDLWADLEGIEVESGDDHAFEDVRVREVRQSLVEPATYTFPTESAFVVETDDGLASVGGLTSGLGPYYEEYAVERVTLYRE